MRKRLIVFVTCQRSGSSATAGYLHRQGMSLGPFPLFGVTEDEPKGFCESLPITQLNHRMHRAIYGFQDDTIDYRLAGHIVNNRRLLLPDLRQLPNDWIREGIHLTQAIVQSGDVSGIKHPACVLFWDFWNHVLSHFPEVSVHLIFMMRSPYSIASSLMRRGQRMQPPEDAFDLIAAYYSRFLHIRKSWKGPAHAVRFSTEHYQADLKSAVENCGLCWNEAAFADHFDTDRIHHEEQRVSHPVEEIYEGCLALLR